jgi:cytochrome o ubiquinol oxidase operon protein cyoD
MGATNTVGLDGHGQGDHHDDHWGGGMPPIHLKDYVWGFVLSVLLTGLAFGLVMQGLLTHRPTAALVLGALAVAQMVVHMVFFLHLGAKVEGGWTMLTTLFTVVFVVVTVAGTLWVMFAMNANMMPSHGKAHEQGHGQAQHSPAPGHSAPARQP